MTEPGYGFVPLPPTVRRIARDEASWDRRVHGTLAGRIELELTAAQPIHVGSGSKQAQQRTVISSGARVRGGPGIPGSSLKACCAPATRPSRIAAPPRHRRPDLLPVHRSDASRNADSRKAAELAR